MIVTEATKELASRILNYWVRTGDHNQRFWVENSAVEVTNLDDDFNICNSSMCAAGTAVFLSVSKNEFKDLARNHWGNDAMWTGKAAPLLGLDDQEAHKLFYSKDESALEMINAIADGDAERFAEIPANPM
jgi:hypothetical protein